MIYILVFFQQLLASGTHIVAKNMTDIVQTPLLLLLRSSIAAIFFSIWYILFYKKLPKIEKKDYPVIALLSLLNIPINQFLFFVSIHLSTAPNIALAYALTPAFVLVIAIVFLKESHTWTKITGVIIAIAGTVLILLEHGFSFSSQYMSGNLLGLLASLSWALYTIFGKKMVRKYGGFYITALTMIFGFVMYVPIFFMTGIPFKISQLNSHDWLGVLYLALFASALAYALWNYALTKLDASKIAVFNNLQPIFTTALAMVFLGYHLTATFIVGGILILAGVWVTQKG